MNTHSTGQLQALQIAQVIDNQDPDRRGRIKVRMQANSLELWASVVVPSAGQDYGTSFIPRLDEIVVVSFISHDMPMILGSVWQGAESQPEEATAVEEKYAVKTPSGTVFEFSDNEPKASLTTRSGYNITIDESSGGEVRIERGTQTITLGTSSIDIDSSGPVNINAATVNVSASMVQVDAGMSKFSGVVQCDTIIATSVVGTTYTPGAGNIW
ncbi:MAG: phage baseplate assembly protein V [Pseudomonadota bacterium]|nr:phage baseplate assembly protein V [Pseudomonadota bacterium]MEE2749016.1 phage baseplate assembly protein V [Pseudomonadota bacterium]